MAGGDYARLSGMAAELVQANVDVILALGPPAVDVARKATATVPIVIVVSIDPVVAGFVKSLARPGGNITGLSNLAGDISPKHLELLHTMAPKASRFAVLMNPGNPAHTSMLKSVEKAAQSVGVRILQVKARTPEEIESAFSLIARERAGAVMVGLDPLFIQQKRQIAGLALQNRLPSIFANREYAEAGGLMSYGQNQVDIYRHAAELVDKILKGARPGDLPVEQPTRLELIVNRKTAQAIGITVQFDELLLHVCHHVGQAGDHSAGTREAHGKSGGYRIASRRVDNRCFRGGLRDRGDRLRWRGNDDGRSLAREILGERLQPIETSIGPALLEHHLRAFFPPMARSGRP